VRVLSFVSSTELRELYGAHDLFLMPSYGEGWPAVVPQAMICGLPCLVSQECFAGFNRDAEHFLVGPRTRGDMVGLMKTAQAQQPAFEQKRAALSAYAADTWDWQRTARIYAELFDRLRSR
jgi:glycosyltransferase involved in cell wall biosynthesis